MAKSKEALTIFLNDKDEPCIRVADTGIHLMALMFDGIHTGLFEGDKPEHIHMKVDDAIEWYRKEAKNLNDELAFKYIRCADKLAELKNTAVKWGKENPVQ
jgi:hypothetical protein